MEVCRPAENISECLLIYRLSDDVASNWWVCHDVVEMAMMTSWYKWTAIMTCFRWTNSVAELEITHCLTFVKILVRIFKIMTPCIPLGEYQYFGYIQRSRYSDWLRAGRLRGKGSSPGRVKKFHFSMLSRPVLGSTQPPIQWVLGALSRG
jgi:hypothetical protein